MLGIISTLTLGLKNSLVLLCVKLLWASLTATPRGNIVINQFSFPRGSTQYICITKKRLLRYFYTNTQYLKTIKFTQAIWLISQLIPINNSNLNTHYAIIVAKSHQIKPSFTVLRKKLISAQTVSCNIITRNWGWSISGFNLQTNLRNLVSVRNITPRSYNYIVMYVMKRYVSPVRSTGIMCQARWASISCWS